MIDYLGDIKASYKLIDKIKRFYKERNIYHPDMRFWTEKEYDTWGRTYVYYS